jgi:hypothetical protein
MALYAVKGGFATKPGGKATYDMSGKKITKTTTSPTTKSTSTSSATKSASTTSGPTVSYGGQTYSISSEDAQKYAERAKAESNISAWNDYLNSMKGGTAYQANIEEINRINSLPQHRNKTLIAEYSPTEWNRFATQNYGAAVGNPSAQYAATAGQIPSIYGNMQGSYGALESYQPSTPGNISYQKPPDYSDMIKRGFEEKRKALLSQIDQALSRNLSGYAGLGDQAQSAFQQALSQNDIERARAIEKIYQATEATGGYRGGQSISGQIAANTMAQQTAGQLRQNLSQQLQDIARAQQALREQAEQQKVGAQAATSAEEIDALVRAQQAADQIALQQQQSQQQQALEWAKFDASKEWQDFQKGYMIAEQAWKQSEDNPDNQRLILGNLLSQLDLMERQALLPDTIAYQKEKLKQDLASGKISMERAMAEIKNMQAQTSLEQQRLNLSRQQLDYQKQQDEYQRQQEEARNQQALYNTYVNQIDNSPYIMRYDGSTQITNPTALRNYIISLNLPDTLTDQLLLRYGLPTN